MHIQYRLGPFGFWHSGAKDSSSNLALRDQQVALDWIQKYISDFGGDKSLVTVSGSSAGGQSVQLLLGKLLVMKMFLRYLSVQGP